ncbi:MAG: V-type ATPase 116kDa subunit family protein [Peptoniphilaceae bacterium]|nr:V-type ATPase 116kDa subunit family protein [Peptoniphilaceae bacterium]MDY6018930.1 V-type ATPase 116kDa subunit family protein [Anaerococcus sp.]
MKFLEKLGFKVGNGKKTKKNEINESFGNENYILIYPKSVEDEVNRSVNSMGFIDKEIPKDLSYDSLVEKLNETERELKVLDQDLEKIKEKNKEALDNVSYTLDYYKKSSKLKDKMVKGEKYFYLSSWVPETKIEQVRKLANKYEDTLVLEKKDHEVGLVPPTKLNNNKLVKPFEFLVNMYGAPNYNEIDPTGFFALTYLLLYGMMFGDLGQGLIFVILSYFIGKKNEVFGSLIRRIGISASIFGLLYGSVFGIETLIPTLLIKPFDNIMTVLIAAVGFGIILLITSYCLGIYNKLVKQKDLEEGFFGKEGFAGLLMMISFVFIILNLVGKKIVGMPIAIGLLVISIIMMVFKEPLSNSLLRNYPLYSTKKSDYYVESSFSIIEALLSVFSNLVSFTRVGAFAINHVGLYMAFEVISKLVGGGFVGLIILILGNILIIGLEGMIVFIQGLRLEFYEMFSKYYKGDGYKFSPISQINEK